jgi:long-chain acyl-CoA synthetase
VFEDARVRDVIAAEVKRVNQSLAGYKRVKKFSLRREEFEKTTTRKVKRYLYTTCPAPHRVGR